MKEKRLNQTKCNTKAHFCRPNFVCRKVDFRKQSLFIVTVTLCFVLLALFVSFIPFGGFTRLKADWPQQPTGRGNFTLSSTTLNGNTFYYTNLGLFPQTYVGNDLNSILEEEYACSQGFQTQTIYGHTYKYIYLGKYPQRYVGDSLNATLEAEYSAGNLENSNYSFSGSMGCYIYQNRDYARVLQKPYTANTNYLTVDGTVVKSGSRGAAKWFKVEPIKWWVMDGLNEGAIDSNVVGGDDVGNYSYLMADLILNAYYWYNRESSGAEYENTWFAGCVESFSRDARLTSFAYEVGICSSIVSTSNCMLCAPDASSAVMTAYAYPMSNMELLLAYSYGLSYPQIFYDELKNYPLSTWTVSPYAIANGLIVGSATSVPTAKFYLRYGEEGTYDDGKAHKLGIVDTGVKLTNDKATNEQVWLYDQSYGKPIVDSEGNIFSQAGFRPCMLVENAKVDAKSNTEFYKTGKKYSIYNGQADEWYYSKSGSSGNYVRVTQKVSSSTATFSTGETVGSSGVAKWFKVDSIKWWLVDEKDPTSLDKTTNLQFISDVCLMAGVAGASSYSTSALATYATNFFETSGLSAQKDTLIQNVTIGIGSYSGQDTTSTMQTYCYIPSYYEMQTKFAKSGLYLYSSGTSASASRMASPSDLAIACGARVSTSYKTNVRPNGGTSSYYLRSSGSSSARTTCVAESGGLSYSATPATSIAFRPLITLKWIPTMGYMPFKDYVLDLPNRNDIYFDEAESVFHLKTYHALELMSEFTNASNQRLSGSFKLDNSINCDGKTLLATKSFGGTFDGAGWSILNLNVTGRGFFDTIDAASVKNINFLSVNITSSATAGGIFGYAASSFSSNVIDNVYFEGKIKGTLVGAFAGFQNQDLSITNSGATVSYDATSASYGFIADISSGIFTKRTIKIQNSYVNVLSSNVSVPMLFESSSDTSKTTATGAYLASPDAKLFYSGFDNTLWWRAAGNLPFLREKIWAGDSLPQIDVESVLTGLGFTKK